MTPDLHTTTPRPRRDYRDLALEHAAADYLELVDRLADLEHAVVVYRELAQVAIVQLAERERERRAAAERYEQLLEEHRRLRGDLVRRAAAA